MFVVVVRISKEKKEVLVCIRDISGNIRWIVTYIGLCYCVRSTPDVNDTSNNKLSVDRVSETFKILYCAHTPLSLVKIWLRTTHTHSLRWLRVRVWLMMLCLLARCCYDIDIVQGISDMSLGEREL